MTPKKYLKILFLFNLKLIKTYQRLEPSITAKYKDDTYQKGSFCGGSKFYLKLVTCKDKIVILSKLQRYVLHWYHTYLLHTGMNRTEAMISQHLYWPEIRDAVRKEVTNCDTCQCTKRPNKKYGELPSKLAE